LVAVGVLSTLTTAMDSLQTSVGELEAIRDNNRVAQCVSSPPNMSLSARSKIDCMRACISYGCSCAYGANYHTDSRVCQLHSDPPDSFEHLPNCVYYQVSLRFYTTRTTGRKYKQTVHIFHQNESTCNTNFFQTLTRGRWTA